MNAYAPDGNKRYWPLLAAGANDVKFGCDPVGAYTLLTKCALLAADALVGITMGGALLAANTLEAIESVWSLSTDGIQSG